MEQHVSQGLKDQFRQHVVGQVTLADDIAYQKGLLANPQILRRSILPSLARQAEAFRKMGFPVFFHSDGNLNDILPNLATIGLTGLQCLEAAAGMDLASIASQYGKDLCLWGILWTQGT